MQRLRLPDLMKGIAILLMIQVHIMELFMDYASQQSIVGKVSLFLGGPFTAMIFMIVMGYFVAASRKSISRTLWRGVKLFMLGLLLNIGLNFHLLLKIKYAGWPYNPLEYIFGVDILYLAGLSIMVLAFLKGLPDKLQRYLSLILFVMVLLVTSRINNWLTFPERNYITPFIGGNWSWSYFPLFPWLAYPLIGYFFYFSEHRFLNFLTTHREISFSLFLLVTVLVVYSFKMGFLNSIDLPAYYHHTFGYGIWALGLLIVWSAAFYCYVRNFPQNTLEKLLAWMGKNITSIYVIQWLIIGNLATAIYQTQPLKNYPFWLGGILLVTLAIGWIYERIRKLFTTN